MASVAADPRWRVLAGHGEEAVRNLALAARAWDARPSLGGNDADLPELLSKAIQKALQDGYASFEQAAEAVLDWAGEPKPSGARWHRDLLVMALTETVARPALAPDLAEPLDELRLFRHLAMHGYARFRLERAAPAVAAGRIVAAALPAALEIFGHGFGLLAPPP